MWSSHSGPQDQESPALLRSQPGAPILHFPNKQRQYGHMMPDLIYMKCPESANPSGQEVAWWVPGSGVGWGGVGVGVEQAVTLMGVGFDLG